MVETELKPKEAQRSTAGPPVRDDRDERVTVIKPAPRWPHLDLSELWHFRELLARLVWRDIMVRYKQTSIGIAWAVLQPFLMMVVFTFIFGRFANFPSKGLPYTIFTYSALLPWTYFASSVALSSASLVSNRGLVTKVYFPRVLLPLASVLVPFADFVPAFLVLGAMMVWYSIWPSLAILLMPVFLVMAMLAALGVGLFLSALNVRYRDVPYIVPFLLQVWFYLSGVVYAINALPGHWQWILAINPMTAVISGFQWGVLGIQYPVLGTTLVSLAATILFFVVGLWFFRRSEPRFADTI
jgi:lipopolysaccharide transport system permease protein